MKRIIYILVLFIGSFAYGQFDFQQLCLDCAEQEGYYCGDDPANWTQYAPNGCVVNQWLNDGWEDCVDAADENGAVPTLPMDCVPPPPDCDTVYVDVIEYIFETDTVEVEVPFYIYETILQIDTVYNTEYITQIVIDTVEVETFVPEYIYITDTVTVYEDVLDTLFIDVIEYVDVFIFDTIVQIETEYIEFFTTDTIIEYVDVIYTEYLDCDTGLPCNTSIPEIIEQSKGDNRMYNLLGQAIRQPEGIYIQDGKVKFKID
tara:strand:+ start:2239 stop:3018 length:780 start_codon:yes stop_codon:yes gene_type:complete